MSNHMESEAMGFDSYYDAQANSPTIRKIFRETLGFTGENDEFAPYSFVSLDDLRRILGFLDLKEGDMLADIACGNASIGIWLARSGGVNLIGVDVSDSALKTARVKAARFGLPTLASFQLGSFESTGLASESVDAIVSIDAIWLAGDQLYGLNELARILKKGGNLVFTSWEQHIPMPFVKQAINDYRPLLEEAGFDVLLYERLRHSEQLQASIYEQIRLSQDALVAEMGDAVHGLIGEAHFVPGLMDGVNYISQENGPHVLAVAKRV